LIKIDYDENGTALSGLSKYLPSAGLVIGLLLVALAAILTEIPAPHMVTASLLITAWFAFTGGLHMDGLMDSADGIFSHQSRERMLEIMSDPRVGNFGVIVGVLLLLTKFATLDSLITHASTNLPLLLLLLLIPAWARFAEVYAIGKFEYLRPAGKGKIWHDSTKFPRDLYLAGAAPLSTTIIVAASSQNLALFGAASFATVVAGTASAHWLTSKLGGQTGDTYGGVVELAEVGGLLAAAFILK
jgi:cobalamin 5'-phosphate synthase/cobalamin synthase